MEPSFGIAPPVLSWAFERQVKDRIERAYEFEDNRNSFKSMIENLQPVILQLESYYTNLDRPRSELSDIVSRFKESTAFINKSLQGNRSNKFLKRFTQAGKLEKLQKSLEKDVTLGLAVRQARDLAEILTLMRQIYDDNGKFLSTIACWTSNRDGDGVMTFRGSFGVPARAKFTVGLEPALEEIKWKILEEKDCGVLVLTAPPGRGKTSLAKMLCHDEKIKGKFGTNILFVSVSKNPKLGLILRDLCSHIGFKEPQLQQDEDPTHKLGSVLEEIGKIPFLLVLDDVWPGLGEQIVKKCNLQKPDHKIVVTSRSELGFKHHYKLKMLNDDDAFTLFYHHAVSEEVASDIPDETMKKVVQHCKNFPLALEIIGTSLCEQAVEIWERKLEEWSSSASSVLESENELLALLRTSLELLPEKLKECFIDLCSFPENQRIAATILIDLWTELHGLSENTAPANLYDLKKSNFADLVITRSDAEEKDRDYSEHFLTLQDMLRELACHESKKEDSKTKRLIVNLSGNSLPDWWNHQNQQPINARLVSITTDGSFSSVCCNIQLPETEVLILNFQAESFTIPEFVKSMTKLKLLILTNQDYLRAKLTNFELLNSLKNLKIIRLEGIDICSLSEIPMQLKNLQKFCLFMCKIGKAFSSVAMSDLLKNLSELNIDYCNDMTTLPSGLIKLKKLRVTHCNKLSSLPRDIGKMENLEELRARCCVNLEELPESICKLSKLKYLGISDCISIRDLPEKIGNMSSLEGLNIRGCMRMKGFPPSILDLEGSLKDVACDEGMKELLEVHLSSESKMKIRVPKEYVNLYGI